MTVILQGENAALLRRFVETGAAPPSLKVVENAAFAAR